MPLATYTGPLGEVLAAPPIRRTFVAGVPVEVTPEVAELLAVHPDFTITEA